MFGERLIGMEVFFVRHNPVGGDLPLCLFQIHTSFAYHLAQAIL
jgi:hypothetical protein